jgi:glycosyltransferase involved in cell wall biosynthesis
LPNVRFVDAMDRADVPAALASADIALVPLGLRLRGAVPSKLYEAMASGVPAVLVAEGEPADILERAGAGVVVRPGDAEGLAAALSALADDDDARSMLGAAGRASAVEFHDRRLSCDRFIDALERAV